MDFSSAGGYREKILAKFSGTPSTASARYKNFVGSGRGGALGAPTWQAFYFAIFAGLLAWFAQGLGESQPLYSRARVDCVYVIGRVGWKSKRRKTRKINPSIVANMKNASAWDGLVKVESPNGLYEAVFNQTSEIGMGGPATGTLVIIEKSTQKQILYACGASTAHLSGARIPERLRPKWDAQRNQNLATACGFRPVKMSFVRRQIFRAGTGRIHGRLHC